jgi:ABC-type nitrate/sulfonate/bicarbonate transport system permease component
VRSANLSAQQHVSQQPTQPSSRAAAEQRKQIKRERRAGYYWMLSIAGLATFFGIWWLAAATGLAPPQFLPTPWEVVQRFVELTQAPFANYTLQTHLWSSLMRYLMVPLGLLMGWFRWLDYIVSPLFEVIRFIAPIAWVPFAALWFGTGIGGPVLIIFAGAFPPCVVNAYRGAKYVEPKLIEAARMLGASSRMIVLEVLLPAALPSIMAGLRVSAGLGWMSLVGAELIVASSGIGYMMVKGQSNIDTPIVMSAMIAIGIVGGLIDVLLRQIENFAMRNRRRAIK